MKEKLKTLLAGVGINDSDYVQQKFEKTGNRLPSGGWQYKQVWKCPYYAVWESIINRCYAPSHIKKNTKYLGCTVCEDWKTFSIFKSWMVSQDWKGKQLDKDFLVKGNKIYNPITCVFITQGVNKFPTDHAKARGKYMLGVSITSSGKFKARCSNPFNTTKKEEVIGTYTTEIEAHLAWKARKHEHGLRLAEEQSDQRIALILKNLYTVETDYATV